jgi:hypothetical protein
MRTLRWLPLTFLAGLHGFALFAAYAALVMLVFLLLRSARRRPHPIPVASPLRMDPPPPDAPSHRPGRSISP